MYYVYTDSLHPGAINATLEHLLQIDKQEDSIVINNFSSSTHDSSEPPKKHRKYSTRIVKVTTEMLCNKMGINISAVKNSTKHNCDIYETFSQQIVSDGEIQWHQHNAHQDTVILSDYNPTTGSLTPLSYPHVICKASEENNEPTFQCTCKMYQIIQAAYLLDYDCSAHQDVVLHESLTCIYCRFFKQHLLKYRNNLEYTSSLTSIDTKISISLKTVNNPIVCLGVPLYQGTTKFSVISENSVSIVHVTFDKMNRCFANCQNGQCKAKLVNKKNVPKSISIEQCHSLCGHIHTLFANFELLQQLFPLYFCAPLQSHEDNGENCDSEDIPLDQDTLNMDDISIPDISPPQVNHTPLI